MRFMVLIKATEETEAGVLPSQEMLEAMGKYNEELVKAGVLLAGDGLQPSSKGARVRFDGDKRTVIDGPFAETKELIAGYWLWETSSLEEAIEWAKRGTPDSPTAPREVSSSAGVRSTFTVARSSRMVLPVICRICSTARIAAASSTPIASAATLPWTAMTDMEWPTRS